MKNTVSWILLFILFLVAISGIVYIIGSSLHNSDPLNPITSLNEQLKEMVAERDATIQQLQTAVNIYYNNGPPDKIDTAAKAGLTEMPGWIVQKIMEHGGDGSIFFQLSASTKQYASVLSTAGPLGYSWQSTTDDALKAAKDRRGKKSK